MDELELYRWVFLVGCSSALAWAVGAVARVPVAPRPRGGFSSQRRNRVFGVDSWLERGLRCGGSWIAAFATAIGRNPRRKIWLRHAERWQMQRLAWAGCPAGLSVHETWFLMTLLAGIGLMAGHNVARSAQTWAWMFPVFGVAVALVPLRLRALASERLLELSHEFPVVIDLTALAMNAGADLPGALAKVAARKSGVVGDELRQLLMALDMGATRRAALLALEARCPVDEVRDVVRAILMADQKGASVADALVQQAQTSRQRRSVKAEESAARAGVLLILPMMLLVACVLILLLGPLLLESNML